MKILTLLLFAFGMAIFGAVLSTWFVTLFVGAAFQTLGLDGPGWQTVFWFVLAARAALGGVSTNVST